MTEAVAKIRGGIPPNEIARLVGHQDPVFLEIGCNNGWDTLTFLEAFGGGRFYCFEPDPRPAADFRKNVTDPRVRFYEVAISDKDGYTTMYRSSGMPPKHSKSKYGLDGDWNLSGSICKPTGHLEYSPWVTFPESHRLEVEMMRLDTWFASAPETEIDFIWADVQGAEALLLIGGQETLRHTRYFYTEFVNPKAHRTDELYEGQPSLEKICQMVPNHNLIAICGNDNALFKRIERV